jgi:amino acid adenylation domain-containing protein/non-ribosomal peptide synthase protein (TIGR01720 family)
MINDVAEKLVELAENGVTLYIADSVLKVSDQEGKLSEADREKLKESKETILKFLDKCGINSNNQLGYLSFQQYRLWLIDKIEPGNHQYNMPGILKLAGALDERALKESIRTIVNRHSILRTVYHEKEGNPYQLVKHTVTADIVRTVDLSGFDKNEQENKIRDFARREIETPFDLSKDLLLRANLLKQGAKNFVLLVTLHHIAADAWSIDIILRELAALYTAYARNLADPLPEPEFQYIDYAHWQRQWLQGGILKKQLDYWAGRLQGIPRVHSVPLDKPRPPVQSYRGGSYRHSVDQALRKELEEFVQTRGVTLFMGLQTAFACLLGRYSGKTDIVMGTPVANRQRPEQEQMVGFFANTLVLRTDLSGNPAFSELLRQNKEDLLNAYEYQQLPFEKLVEELQPERSLSHSPLFQILFVLQNNKQPAFKLPGLDTSTMRLDETASKFDLTLEVVAGDNGLLIHWEYITDLFREETIRRMAEHFMVLLRGAIERPETRVSALPLLTQAESHRLLREWNDTGTLYPKEQCVHELFQIQAARIPGSIAVLFNELALSYEELNARSNRLAHYLIEQGVKPETLVGLNVERSLDMLVGVLGILKAGGAYLPLDPGYPAARLEYMLNDSGVDIVLSHAHLREKMAFGDRRVVSLDDADLLAELNRYSGENPEKSVTGLSAANVAYVIYTSGSTGQPKGVMIEHTSLMNFLCSMRNAPGISANDALLSVTSTSFDIHTLELYLPLISGARVIIATADDTVSPASLSALMVRHGVSIMQATPSTWKMLLTENWEAQRPMKILCGGEAWSTSLKHDLLRRRNVELWNMYGPTETTVWSSVKKIVPQDGDVHLGPGIANTQLYVLDENRELCPVGIPGELYIGGEGLARGYLNRPELTAERFVGNPFSDRSDSGRPARMYRTGDLVRWLPEGDLQFMGRLDQQVKIRGFRIELEEIENQLSKSNCVQSAVVVAREDEPGNKRLVAYITADKAIRGAGSDSDLVNTLRTMLHSTLPGYMVPAAFVLLDAMPLTPNGKIDKKALPMPEGLPPADEYVAPGTDAESTLAGIWSQLLAIDLDRLSVTANFFALGGDSILSIQMVARAAKAGLRLTVKQLFEHQTIQTLALVIGAGTLAEPALPDDAGPNADSDVPVIGDTPLTVDQASFLGSGFNMPQWGIIIKLYEQTETFNPAILEDAINEVLMHHDAMRASFKQEEGGWHQTINEPRRRKIVSTVDLSHWDSEMVEQQVNDIARDLVQSFDLSTGPLIKIVQINLGAGRPKRLLLAIHHLICDGYSLEIFSEDIVTAYQQLLTNQPVNLPEKTTSVKYWVARLKEYANSDELRQEARYWENLPWSDMPKLPVDFAGGEHKRYVGSHTGITSSLSAKDTLRLMNDLPRRYGVSVFDAITAALVATLSAWLKSDKVLLCVHGSGRNVLPDMQGIDLSRTVGWLSYRRLVLLQKPETEDVSGLLRSVSMQLKTLPNQGAGFGILSTYNKDKAVRDKLGAIPVPQVWLNYAGVHVPDKEGPGQFQEIVLDKYLWTPPNGGAPRNIQVPFMHPDNQEAWYILLNSGIRNNRFYMHWRYSENLYRRETIEALADNYLTALRAMAALPV